jgi:gluconokinase
MRLCCQGGHSCYNGQVDCVLTLDVGSSSARTLLFGFDGKPIPGFGSQVKYHAQTTEDGGWEIDPKELTGLVAKALAETCSQLREKSIKPAAVAVDTFWHSILGVGEDGAAVTPVLHPFDNRSAPAAAELAKRIDNKAQHARTGCMLHPSYPPAKILWLSGAGAHPKRWMSVGEYLFQEFFGQPVASTSMISACGLWDQNRNTYDPELLAALSLTHEQLADPATMDLPLHSLVGDYKTNWPELDGIPWFPALGDGACDNIGSGCISRDEWALMVGTSGALRCTVEADSYEIPDGLFCYRIDRKRFVTGGALSNGGEVYAWMRRTLQLPDDATVEAQLAALKPGLHGLTILPLLAGERSPEWRSDTTAAVVGLRDGTTALEILHASLASVALRFRNVYEIMVSSLGEPRLLIGSGAALSRSQVWTQMMADTLGHAVRMCLEPEATSRGAALPALERIGAIPGIGSVPVTFGDVVATDPGREEIYKAALAKQRRLYQKLFEEI